MTSQKLHLSNNKKVLHRKKFFSIVAYLGLLKYICCRNYKFMNFIYGKIAVVANTGITAKILAIILFFSCPYFTLIIYSVSF